MKTKTYYAPGKHALTGQVMNAALFQPEFQDAVMFWGLKNIDAPLPLPMGGVKVLFETDNFVMAKDFVSARAS